MIDLRLTHKTQPLPDEDTILRHVLRQLAPQAVDEVAEHWPVDTGASKRGLGADIDFRRGTVEITDREPYAVFVERNTGVGIRALRAKRDWKITGLNNLSVDIGTR